jgi:hypothetical protein
MTKPITGEEKRGIITLSNMFVQFTTSKLPVATIAEPIRLPISAWEELLGKAMYQVKRFQTMAPHRADAIIYCSGEPFKMPDAMVFATFTLTSAPIKFSEADIRVAARGDRTRVETEVAMEFAVS